MGKAKPVHPGGLALWSLHRAFRTAAAGRETNQAQRAHHMAMGTLRWVYLPGQLEKRGQAPHLPRSASEASGPYDCQRVAHNGLLSLDNLLIENTP